MRKITIVMLIISMILVVSGCEQPNYEGTHIEVQHEKPVLHTQDIDVEITSISKTHRYVKVHRYYVSMEVHSKEYDLSGKFSYDASGMFITLPAWSYNKGDIVKAELHTWIYESTGLIHKQYINKVY